MLSLSSSAFPCPARQVLTADIWVAFDTGKNYPCRHVNAICHSLVRETSAVLPMFHCFTGCDTISAFCGKGKKSAWKAWSSYPEVTHAFNYMAANRHSPLTIDGHTSNVWSATQSSLTRRRAIRVLSMNHEESCSARRTKRWNTSNQLKIPNCSSQNELPTSLEYERHVNWPISRHPVKKDVYGLWMETAMQGVLFGTLCRWLRKPAFNWASAVAAEAHVVVVEGACYVKTCI